MICYWRGCIVGYRSLNNCNNWKTVTKMGKKDKKKNKVSGSVKTALKTEKKLNAKQKKELAAIGEVS